jgi:hypothetical protein
VRRPARALPPPPPRRSPLPAFSGPPSAHLDRLTRELEAIAEASVAAGPLSPVLRVNAHSGSDAWSEDEAAAFLASAVEAASRIGEALPPVSHETHRGRALCCPFATARLLRRVPQLRLTSDLSHWVVKTERMLDTAPEQELLLGRVAPAVDHLHARVGTPQAPQVASLAESATTARAAERFYGWWEACWAAAEARSLSSRDSTLTATVEYGPAELGEDGQVLAGSYSPLDLHGRHVSGVGLDDTLAAAAAALRSRPAPCGCSEPLTPAATPAAGGTRTRRAGWRCWRDAIEWSALRHAHV